MFPMKRQLNESTAPSVLRLYGPIKPLTERKYSDGTPVLEITGVFQNYKNVNSNGRLYPRGIWERVLHESSDFMQKVKRRGVLGVLEHPGDSRTKIFEASHVITNAWIATPHEIAASKGVLIEGDVLGTYEVLNTRAGQDLRALHEGRCEVGVSSRGAGSVTVSCDMETVDCDDYDLDTWDVVAVPSVVRATPTPSSVMESLEESGDPAHPAPGETPTPPGSAEPTPPPAPAEDDQPPSPKTGEIKESTQTTKMNRQAEFRTLRNTVNGLIGTKVKGMRPTQVAALVESLEESRLAASTLASEDTTLTALAFGLCESVQRRLNEMDEEFDEAPPAAGPSPDCDMDPVAVDVINRAVEFLRADEDPEALEIADDLEDTIIAHDPQLDADIDAAEVKALPESLQRKVIALSKRNNLLSTNYSRLEACSSKLLERSQADRGKLALRESSGGPATSALRKQLAEALETRLVLANEYIKVKLPDLYEASRKALSGAPTLEAFEAIVESALKDAPAKPKLTEARRAALKKRLQERRNTPPAPAPANTPPAPAPEPVPAPVKGDLHETVALTRRMAGRKALTA